jgi:hypothetical protein
VLSPLVSMECEKTAVRDFHIAVNPEDNAEAIFTQPTDGPAPDMVEGGPEASEFTLKRKIEINESKIKLTAVTTPMKKNQSVLPLPKSVVQNEGLFSNNGQKIHIIPGPQSPFVMDDTPSHIVGQNI